MVEIAAALSMANAAFNGIKRAVEMGRDVEDVAGYFGKFFDAKESISEANQYATNQPLAKKLFSGSSVEAQALEVTAAKHKAEQLEKELREFLLWSGQGQFYEDMMKERRRIRDARIRQAKQKAENRKFILDCITVVVTVITVFGIVMTMVAMITKG